jgi:RecA/RadA recombinase
MPTPSISLQSYLPKDIIEAISSLSPPMRLDDFLFGIPTHQFHQQILPANLRSKYPKEWIDKIRLKILVQHGPKVRTLAQDMRYDRKLWLDVDLSSGSEQVDHQWSISLGSLTEFSGDPGSGKTQMAMTCAVNTVASGYCCLWIDTQHSFNVKRFSEIYNFAETDISKKEALKRVDHRYCFSLGNFMSMLHSICRSLEEKRSCEPFWQQLRLIVIDSFTSLVLTGLGNQQVSKMTEKAGHLLKRMASKFDIAIILTNFSVSRGLNQPQTTNSPKPAMGEFSWGNIPNKRIIFQVRSLYGKEIRTVRILKHLYNLGSQTQFLIGKEGVKGLSTKTIHQEHQD